MDQFAKVNCRPIVVNFVRKIIREQMQIFPYLLIEELTHEGLRQLNLLTVSNFSNKNMFITLLLVFFWPGGIHCSRPQT